MSRTFIILGALFMFLGVGAGAFGAHGLSSYFAQFPDLEATWETAVTYQIYHAFGLLITAFLVEKYSGSSLPKWAGYLSTAGILLFSGSLYLLIFTRTGWFGAITPLGGLAFLSGWLLILIAAWRSR